MRSHVLLSMSQLSCGSFFLFFAELSLRAYSASKTKNAPCGASFSCDPKGTEFKPIYA